jgi:hypothetical protein
MTRHASECIPYKNVRKGSRYDTKKVVYGGEDIS